MSNFYFTEASDIPQSGNTVALTLPSSNIIHVRTYVASSNEHAHATVVTNSVVPSPARIDRGTCMHKLD
jgi:hypothetical protein